MTLPFPKQFKVVCEQVRRVRITNGVRQYLIKWMGLPEIFCSWELPHKLAAFRKDVQRFNLDMSYEIQWMEQEYILQNSRFLQEYPLQPFEITKNKDLELEKRIRNQYAQYVRAVQQEIQIHSVSREQQKVANTNSPQVKLVETVEISKFTNSKTNRNKQNGIFKHQNGIFKHCQRQLLFQNTTERNCPIQKEIERALEKLIQTQRENRTIPSPPLGFQDVSFEVEMSVDSIDQLNQQSSQFGSLQSQSIQQIVEQQPLDKAVSKPDYGQIEENIKHYKQFFQGKYSIYHYPYGPSDSDQDQSSYPPKHASSDASESNSVWSSSIHENNRSPNKRIVKKMLNLNEKTQKEQAILDAKVDVSKLDQQNPHKSDEEIISPGQEAIITVQMHAEEMLQEQINKYQHIEPFYQHLENHSLLDQPNQHKKQNQQGLEDLKSNQMQAQNVQKSSEQQFVQVGNNQELNQMDSQLQNAIFQQPKVSELHQYQRSEIEQSKVLRSIQSENHSNHLYPQAQPQSMHNPPSQNHEQMFNYPFESSNNDSNNFSSLYQKEEYNQINFEQQPSIQQQPTISNHEANQENEQADSEQSVRSNHIGKPVSEKHSRSEYSDNSNQQQSEMRESNQIEMRNVEDRPVKQQDEIMEISIDKYLSQMGNASEPTKRKTKPITKQYSLKKEHIISNSHFARKNIKIVKHQTNQMVYMPMPLGDNYSNVRKNVDKNTLTWTEMFNGRVPAFVKLLEQITVDDVDYVYCVFWEQQRQLFEKFVMVVHFRQFYAREFESYRNGGRVGSVQIQVSDLQ